MELTALTISLRKLKQESDNAAVGVWAGGGQVHVQVGNGGDFGSTDWCLSADQTVRLASYLLVAAETARAQK